MGRFCDSCKHPSARRIDTLLRSGSTLTYVAKKFGLSVSSLQRHKAGHLDMPPSSKSPLAAVESDGAPSIVGKLNSPEAILAAAEALVRRTESLLNLAESDGDVRSALQAVKIMLDGLTGFFAKYHRMIDDTPRVDARSLNIFEGVSTETLRALRDALAAGDGARGPVSVTTIPPGADH